MKSFLCLDLGTTTGWAMAAKTPSGKTQVQSGIQSFAINTRFEGGGMRFLKFRRWMDEMHKLCSIERLAFEEVQMRHASIAAGHAYGGFLGTLTAWCEENSVPYEGVPVSVVKKHTTGKGNAKKEAMIAAMVAKGYNPQDDNEADALAILHWLLDHATPSSVDLRPAPDRQPTRRVSLEPVALRRRPVSR